MTARMMPLLRWGWIALVTGLCLWPMQAVIADEEWGRLGYYLIVTPLLTLFCFAKSSRHWQLLYPALLAVTWSILLPIACTLLLAFSNYSDSHLYSQGYVYQYLQKTQRIAAGPYDYSLFKQPDGRYFLQLSDPQNNQWHYHSAPIALLDNEQWVNDHLNDGPIDLALEPGMAANTGTAVTKREIVHHIKHLRMLRFALPGSQSKSALVLQLRGIIKIAGYTDSYLPASEDPNDETLIETRTKDRALAVRYAPNQESGYYQAIDKQGQFYGPPLEPGFYTHSPHYLWQHIKDLSRRFDSAGNTVSPQLFDNAVLTWLNALPWLYTWLWSLVYGLVCITLSAALATLNAFCLQGRRESLTWLRLLVLPAAIPLGFYALIFYGFLKPNMGELYIPLSQLIEKKFAHADLGSNELYYPLCLLLCTSLTLTPLLTLWFSRLTTDLDTMPLLTFAKQVLLRNKPALLLLFSILMLAQPLYSLANDCQYYFRREFDIYPIGLIDTLGPLLNTTVFSTGSDEAYTALSCSQLLFIFPVALLLGWCRYRALHQPIPQYHARITDPQRPKPTIKRLQTLWLGTMALLLWLPLLVLIFVSIRQGQLFYLREGESIWSLWPVEFTLDHFRSVFNMTIRETSGMLIPPPFPFMKMLGISLGYAASMTLLTLAIALPAAWTLARYQFAARQTLYRLGIVLQALMPALLADAIYHLAYGPPVTMYLVANLGIVLLAIFPLTAAIQQFGDSESWRQVLARLKPILLTLSVLLFLQQIGERVLSDVMLPNDGNWTLAQGLKQSLYRGNYVWGDFAAAMLVLALPLMALFYWLVPRIDRNLINHWRPM